MNFQDTLQHNSVVAYIRKDGSFSYWRLDKEAAKKDGFMRCESLTNSREGFPIKNFKVIYPIIGGVRGERFLGWDGGIMLEVVFERFVFPPANSTNKETEVQVVTTNTGNIRKLQFTHSHFVQQFTPVDFTHCAI